MQEDTTERFAFPAIGRKKLTAAFDGGRLTSDGGVMLLAAAERRIGIAQTLAPLRYSDLYQVPDCVTRGIARRGSALIQGGERTRFAVPREIERSAATTLRE